MHILPHDENGRRHVGVRTLDLSDLAIANLGFEPNARTRDSKFVTCDQIADLNTQTMQVEFAGHVDSPPSNYNEYAAMTHMVGRDFDWDWLEADEAVQREERYENYHDGLKSEQVELPEPTRNIHGRKLWFEKIGTPYGMERFEGQVKTTRKPGRQPPSKGSKLPRRRDMAPAHRAFA